MSELAHQICTEAKELISNPEVDMQRSVHRSIVLNIEGFGVDIEQTRFVQPQEIALVQAKGALAVATTSWFNDVEWLNHPRSEARSWRELHLNATYPLDYFDEPPVAGSFVGDEDNLRWRDQYGAISGFGDGNGINLYVLRFVRPGSRSVTELRYPDDPTSLDEYNERYRQYLQTLDEADPKIEYYRGWDYAFSRHRSKTPLVLGGLSLAGVGVNEVVTPGAAPLDEDDNCTRILLHHEPKRNGYVGRDVIIVGDEAVTEPYWDGENDREPASEELLETTLELMKRATL